MTETDESAPCVVFRYDDCSAVSSLELERGFVDAFATHGVEVTIAVIPAVVSGSFHDSRPQATRKFSCEKAAWLRELGHGGSAEIALHGYSHQRTAYGPPSEFAGRTESDQDERIARGRAILEDLTGATVTTFVPPWNEYDRATAQLLERHGFTVLSASVRGPFDLTTTLRLLPATCRADAVLNLVAAIMALGMRGSTVVVMMHDFDFFESGKQQAWLGLADLRRLLDDLQRAGARLCSVRQAALENTTAIATLNVHAQWWRQTQRLASVSWTYRRLLENQVLWPASSRARVWIRQSTLASYCVWQELRSRGVRGIRARP